MRSFNDEKSWDVAAKVTDVELKALVARRRSKQQSLSLVF